MNRDMIQSFIDGYIYSGGDPSTVQESISEWMKNHPTYSANDDECVSVLKDIGSYRVSTRSKLSPSFVSEVILK